ncbi:unnamed protein product [Onchocerca flexuosa]|uniref:Uncharacterized protein n=1 Tax=Onchocerca flexuosa TaxID=387005 RepID=A0A183HPQ8_9BILA|nr:unnamed protein product [Onchocerca flexuosa]
MGKFSINFAEEKMQIQLHTEYSTMLLTDFAVLKVHSERISNAEAITEVEKSIHLGENFIIASGNWSPEL